MIHIIVSYDQNISSIFYVKDGSNFRLRHPSCAYITAQRQYTAVQKTKNVYTSEISFFALLHPCIAFSIVYNYCTHQSANICIQGYLLILWIRSTKSSKIDWIQKCFVICLKLQYFVVVKLNPWMGITCNKWPWDGTLNVLGQLKDLYSFLITYNNHNEIKITMSIGC